MIFSASRVEYVLPSPPNDPERPLPRCWSNIAIIRSAPNTVCAMVIGVMLEIETFEDKHRRHDDETDQRWPGCHGHR